MRFLLTTLEVERDNATEDRRARGTGTEDVERAKLEEAVRVRGTGAGDDDDALRVVRTPFVSCFASPSVHCKCNITDLVAHYQFVDVNQH